MTEPATSAMSKEIAEIRKLDVNEEEAMYKWIDREIGIPKAALVGTAIEEVDAFPVYFDTATGTCYATAVCCIRSLLHHLKRPLLCGLVKYDTRTEEFLEAIPLHSWPQDSIDDLKRVMQAAYCRAEVDYKLLGLETEGEEC